jgi:hypothetical protein
MWSTWLAREYRKSPLNPLDPGQWVAEVGESQWRLYLRIGEEYSEGGLQQLVPPIKVAIKSQDEYVQITELPLSQWWQAEFVCPFCGRLNLGEKGCEHTLVAQHWVLEPYRNRNLVPLLRQMWDRRFICNLANLNLNGLRIKVPRCSVGCEWFRFAYWYIRDPEVIPPIEQLLELERTRSEAERSTAIA